MLTLPSGVESTIRTVEARRQIRIPVDDFGCAGSAPSIERQLAKTSGVFDVYANPATEHVYVNYDPAQVSPDELVRELNRAGYRTGRPIEA